MDRRIHEIEEEINKLKTELMGELLAQNFVHSYLLRALVGVLAQQHPEINVALRENIQEHAKGFEKGMAERVMEEFDRIVSA